MTERTMTVARALKTKNRLVEKLGKARSTVQGYNSFRVGQDVREYNIEQKMDESTVLMGNLVSIKTSIDKANRPIREQIYEMAELKSHIAFLRGISTRRGKERSRYMQELEETEYDATFKQAELDSAVDDAEARIDELQAVLDDHNSSTRITVKFADMPKAKASE